VLTVSGSRGLLHWTLSPDLLQIGAPPKHVFDFQTVERILGLFIAGCNYLEPVATAPGTTSYAGAAYCPAGSVTTGAFKYLDLTRNRTQPPIKLIEREGATKCGSLM